MKKYFVLICLLLSWNCFAGGPMAIIPKLVPEIDTNCNQAKYFPLGTLCQDTDDGKLYKGTGAAVVELAAGASGDVVAASIAQTWGNTADPVVWTFDVTGTNPTITATASTFTFGGSLAIGANNITGTGSLGATGAGKFTKGWFVDGEFTNYPTVNGNAVFDQDVSADGNPSFGTINVVGTNSINVGTGSSAAGQVKFKNATNNNILTFQSGVVSSSYSMTFPTATSGGDNYLLNMDANGVMDWTDPATLGSAFTGGTLTSELVIDETGIEGQPTDAIANCSSYSATGGGIFYDDSEGKWKKCQDNTLSDLDTSSGFSVTDITGQTDDTTPATTATMVLAQGGSLIESTVAQAVAEMVDDTPDDNDTTTPPSENALVDGLALKASITTIPYLVGADIAVDATGDTSPAVTAQRKHVVTATAGVVIASLVDSTGDYSEFSNGNEVELSCQDKEVSFDFTSNTEFGFDNGGVDFTCSDTIPTTIKFEYDSTNTRWNVISGIPYGYSNPTTANFLTITIPTTTSGDQTVTVGQLGLKTDEDLLVTHGGANGEVQSEVGISLLQHISIAFDPAWAYAQDSVNRAVPIGFLGDDFPHGFTMTEWKVAYVGGDPTTELDADIICDTTPNFAVGAGATVMDVIDTTAGASTADTGFDSATCANGSQMYIHFGADPADANVMLAVDIWGYAEED